MAFKENPFDWNEEANPPMRYTDENGRNIYMWPPMFSHSQALVILGFIDECGDPINSDLIEDQMCDGHSMYIKQDLTEEAIEKIKRGHIKSLFTLTAPTWMSQARIDAIIDGLTAKKK